MTTEELRTTLSAEGTTLADVAAAEGVEAATLVDALVAEGTERINPALADGRITQEEADEKIAVLPERVAALIEDEPRFRGGHGDGARGAELPDEDEVAPSTTEGTTAATPGWTPDPRSGAGAGPRGPKPAVRLHPVASARRRPGCWPSISSSAARRRCRTAALSGPLRDLPRRAPDRRCRCAHVRVGPERQRATRREADARAEADRSTVLSVLPGCLLHRTRPEGPPTPQRESQDDSAPAAGQKGHDGEGSGGMEARPER